MSQAPPTNFPADGMPYQQQHYQRADSATPSVASLSSINPGDPGALYTRLRTQVEFYFSPQNLARDVYLRNMLTAKHQEVPSPPPLQLMAPVGVITNFPKVRDICAAFGTTVSDPPHVLLARACDGSAVVAISPDGAWIGPASQQLPPLTAPTPRMGPPQPQSHFQQGPYPPSPHQRMMMVPVNPNSLGDVQPLPYMGPQPVPFVQNIPLSQGSISPSSNNSLDSTPSQVKEAVVVVSDMPAECNPIQLMGVFATDTVRPKAVSADGNSNIWYITFATEADAKAAITASSEKTIAGVLIKAKLKVESPSAKVSVASASGASLSSMSENQRQSHMQHPGGPQMTHQPIPIPGGAVMYPPGAYPGPQPSPPPIVQPGMPPYVMGPHYNMAPMPMAGVPGQPFPPYPQHMQPMYPYYMPQQGHPPFPMNQPPMGRFGPGVPPPPPRYPGPPYPYQHGPQHHHAGDGHGHHHGYKQPPRRQHSGEGRHTQEGAQKKSEQGGTKKKNKFQRSESCGSDFEGGNSQHQHGSRENTGSSNNFATQGRTRGRHGDNFRRSAGSSSPAFNKNQRNGKQFGNIAQTKADAKDDKKEIFTPSDFPGLGGGIKSPGNSGEPANLGQKNEAAKLRGYADALLKKGGQETDSESYVTRETLKSEIDSITRQTEAMERENTQ